MFWIQNTRDVPVRLFIIDIMDVDTSKIDRRYPENPTLLDPGDIIYIVDNTLLHKKKGEKTASAILSIEPPWVFSTIESGVLQ